MRWLGSVAFAVMLSGCLGGGSSNEGPTSGAAALEERPAGAIANNTTLPTLGPAIDPWPPNATETLVIEATIDVTSQLGSYVEEDFGGAARIPDGTGWIRVEADASGATQVGKWTAYVAYTYGGYVWEYGNRSVEGEPSSKKAETWRFPMLPRDWDPPGGAKGAFALGLWAVGTSPGGAVGTDVLQGPVKVKIVAERDPAWVPLPVVDAWAPGSGYRSTQEGVVVLLDDNVTIAYPSSPTQATPGAVYPDPVRFASKTPAGAEQVALGLAWGDVEGCVTPGECSVRGGLSSGRLYTGVGSALHSEVSAHHRIVVFDVGDHVVVDGPYVNRSATLHDVWLDDCSHRAGREALGDDGCGAGLRDLRADVHYYVEAWRGEVDLAAFRARLGVA